MHALGRLHAIRVVNDVWNVVLGAHGGQFLQPGRQSQQFSQNSDRRLSIVSQPTCRGHAGQSRRSSNGRTRRSRLRAPGSFARRRPGPSVTRRPRGRSRSPPVQSLVGPHGRLICAPRTRFIPVTTATPPTCSDHGFETRLLVDARPNDVTSLRPPVAEGQETQGQAHPRRHGNNKAANRTSNAC